MNTDWFKADNFTKVEDVNVHPNVSVFNRKLYTFGDKGETYIKFSYINSCIQSQDEIAYLDSRSCGFKISDTRFIVVLKGDKDTNAYAVIGELGTRYITTNKLLEYDVEIRSPDDYTIIPMREIYDSSKLDYESLSEMASSRVKKRFDAYIKDIRNN
ncbi:hypothetical protein JA9_003722 [Meyerozyma sp. JA9]|nr:hypothetical protein JA9_003722 [Meyerozyma sp. JA9]